MDRNSKPDIALAQKVLPAALFTAIQYLFQKGLSDTGLVGGTALAGFYAAHRRSDDIDLFTKNDSAQRASVLTVKSLQDIGAKKLSEQESAFFYDSSWSYQEHQFTVQVVQDSALFSTGSFVAAGPITVANLQTIFKMKAATLVSRCSEKDLFDLLWLFKNFPDLHLSDLINLGFEIDAGVNAENMLAAVSGALLREEACDFSTDKSISGKEIYREILQFKKDLQQQLIAYLRAQPTPELGKLVRYAKKVLK
jgi:hypothetical protein